MAIAPIDLQTIYAQMGHLAKLASDQQNGPHLAQQLQESRMIQQNAEKARMVSKAADNESKTMIVGKDGKRQNRDAEQPKDDSEESGQDSEDSAKSKLPEIRESYLGNHVNIST
ncbi:MAG: hypothetical protein IKN34_09370 [Treponema sp.]|nr:hypothetical protein [Treponema sp.]